MAREIEVIAQSTDFEGRALILELLGHKARINKELENPELNVLRRNELEGILANVGNLIQTYRFSGIMG